MLERESGQNNMQDFVIMGFILFLTYLSVRIGSQWLVRLMGVMGWVFWMGFYTANPPFGLIKGSSLHSILTVLLPIVGMIACAVVGNQRKEKDVLTNANKGFSKEKENYGWHIPSWMGNIVSSNNEEKEKQEKKEKDQENYEDRMDRALRLGKYNNRKS